MNIYALLSFILLCSVGFVKYSLDLLEKYFNWRASRFKNDESEFMASLIKLQNKWVKRGRIDFSNALGYVIQGFNLPDEEQSKTPYGKDISKLINNEQ